MAADKKQNPPQGVSKNPEVDLTVGVPLVPGKESITARRAGGITDMKLPVSLKKVSVEVALQNLVKAINLALQPDFLETELEPVYSAAKVVGKTVKICHKDYIGLGDGVLAQVGKSAKSITLTLSGADPASPDGKRVIEKGDGGMVSGVFNLLGRKLNLLQEFEDKVPTFVEQMLDRLEAANMITGWDRSEWSITTEQIGLDVLIEPAQNENVAAAP
ncbi:MAG: hypothetical protein U1D30_04885 [Planctomycetota bacterium]